MLHRATTHASVYVEALGREVALSPFTVLDDRDKDDAKILRAHPELFAPEEPESATAAPGERRNTSRRTRA